MKREISLELILQLHQFIAAEDPVFCLSSSLIKLPLFFFFFKNTDFLLSFLFFFSVCYLLFVICWNAELTKFIQSQKFKAKNSLNVGPAWQYLSPESQLKTPDLCIFIIRPRTLLYSWHF